MIKENREMLGHWSKTRANKFVVEKVRAYYKTLGVSEKRVKEVVRTARQGFKKWMRGQTVPVLENGQSGYYSYDVKRYVDMILYGTPTIFD